MEWTNAAESSTGPSSKGLIVAVVAMLGLFVAPAVATADEAPADEDEGLVNLRTANDAFDDEEFDEAYEYYVKAYEILEIPEIKYRMGQTAEKTDRVEMAVDHYEAYREIGEDEEFLGRIDESLPKLRDRLPASLEVVTDPDGARVVVDDGETREEVGQAPVVVERPPGDVEIRLELEDYDSKTVDRQLEPGGDVLVEATLEPVDDEPVAEAETDDEPDAEPDEELDEELAEPMAAQPEVDDSSLGVWGWTSTGLGASILALGGVMSIFQYQTTQEVNEFERETSGSPADWQQQRQDQDRLRDDAESYHQAATGAYIAGGLLTTAGLSVLMYDAFSSDDQESSEPGVRLRGGVQSEGGFIGIDGRF